MKTFELRAELRTDLGKKATKSLRKQNIIPAVIYGGAETRHLTVTKDDVRNLIYTPEIFDIDLSVNGQVCKAVLKDLQFHPVTDEVLHIDFLEVNKEKPIEMEVPVVLEGHAAGVRAGGKLVLEMRKLRVKAVYDQIPEKLHINVENLELGKSMQVGTLSFEGLEIMNAKNAVVCAVRLTRAARGAAAKK
ncbi:MAG: 50S ribosomal protein L25/general stress protein Ctc [Bacteroidales bacterium]|nr:50S ribosomal protein L25/general stress protein Ctc [Porphyromonas sp.]MDD6933866.1 50S ribosomal protein L25/general stress protein Ctc [Bacteroidales bacterium]MDY3102087.1 50S ribosomal protein L25/general stress protein Ctc [Porphyromonas sp.]